MRELKEKKRKKTEEWMCFCSEIDFFVLISIETPFVLLEDFF